MLCKCNCTNKNNLMKSLRCNILRNKIKPTNPNAHTYVMQSRAIPFCNSLFEQSCACFPCYQSAVWSGKCRVWSVK